MMLTATGIQALRDRPESDAWSAVTALQQVLNVLLQLEQNETDEEVLRDLSAASIEATNELEEVLDIIEEKWKAEQPNTDE